MTDAAGATWPVTEGALELGDLEVERGGAIRDARLVYATYGTLSPDRDNVVVYPCSYTATHDELAWLIGPDGVLDPTRWFVVVPDMFGNALSSSPSQADPHDPTAWPAVVTVADNVRAQHRLLTEVFDVQRVAAVYGFSMGAGQAYHWAAMHPELVDRAIVVCGSARTAVHNQVFLRGLLRVLEAAPEHLGGGRFAAEPVAAKRAFAEVYAGWGLSQDFYRAELYRTVLGFADLDAFLRKDWVEDFARSKAADLYAQATTWLHGDISATGEHAGDLPAALAAIRAKVLLVPSETDLYFRVADNEAELEHLRDGRLAVIPSIWGHWAGSPEGLPDETAFLTRVVREFLDA
ncbi:MAG: alpha/beta fold hydrolase [Acidobacteria bacterium]|nr:alpha/beta fold hydrolase [Acidobacteriota bacterium]